MTTSHHIPLVEVTRGRIVESVHYGSISVVKREGNMVFSAGDTSTKFFLRSSAKPFQALAFLERGGVDYYNLTLREIALMCASHSGTEAHIQTLETLQKKVGIDESALKCGTHMPFWKEGADKLLLQGADPRPNHNNCSGKHTAMLAFAKMIGAPLEGYLEPDHPVQKAILETFSEMCEIDTSEVETGTDGCTAPVFAVPLPNAAAGYARLCQPEGLAENRAKACRLISGAMPAHADMVAGPQRFDTDGMIAGGGAFISKIGAEGYQAIGILPGKAAGIASSLGVTLKISDGDALLRAGSLISMTVLKALKVLNQDQIAALNGYDRRPIKNWLGKDVGEIRPTAELMQLLVDINVN